MSVVEKSIGELLVDNGQISAEELRLAEREAKSTGELLSVILQRLGLAYEHHFKNALELKYGVTYVSLARTDVQAEILKKVPESKLREHMMVPVNEKGSRITVVMVNPEHAGGLSALKEYFADRQFTPVVCTEDDFILFMSNLYTKHLDTKIASQPESNGAKEEDKSENKPQESAQPAPATAPEPEAKAEKPQEMPKDSADSLFDSVLKKEVEPPTNDETGKFDLNMLQKHIEETRNKSGKKPAEDGKKETAKDRAEETVSEESPGEKSADKPAETAAKSSEESKEPQTKSEPKQEEAQSQPEIDKGESKADSADAKEEKKETRPDARDVARALAKEMAEESKGQAGGAIKDDEATGEFEALLSPAAAKAAAGAKVADKAEAPEKSEPAAKETAKEEPAKEEPAKEPPAEEKSQPAPQAAQPEMDQTGEDFKAVSPKAGPEGGFGECEPVASESVARPTTAEQKSPSALEKEGDDAAVIMLCNQILANGIAKGASTIHVEAVDKQVLVHYRIQQQLMIVRKLPKMLMPALTARFRKMARVDTQDRRLPQDGRVKVRMSGKDFSLRLTIVPHTAGGEHILVWIE